LLWLAAVAERSLLAVAAVLLALTIHTMEVILALEALAAAAL
jgi:hypothetical protein